jgi:CDP-L-myo-inositol myo-inositolphosphotransferase
VAQFVAQRGLDVELVENERFSVGNGSSALAGAQVAGERFVLMMCDHLVEPKGVARMIACRAPFAVAVDTRPVYCDAAEATKVRLADGAVVEVGRDLASWDAVDAGIFVCDKSVVETAEHALAAGEGSWNAVKRRWIEQGRRLEAIDLNGAFWVDVDTPQDARRAERLLVARAASKPLDGFVSRTLNRPLSRRVSLLLVRKGVSPTSVTLATFGLALAAAALIALGAHSTLALAAGGLLVQFASVVDGCDGRSRARRCAHPVLVRCWTRSSTVSPTRCSSSRLRGPRVSARPPGPSWWPPRSRHCSSRTSKPPMNRRPAPPSRPRVCLTAATPAS